MGMHGFSFFFFGTGGSDGAAGAAGADGGAGGAPTAGACGGCHSSKHDSRTQQRGSARLSTVEIERDAEKRKRSGLASAAAIQLTAAGAPGAAAMQGAMGGCTHAHRTQAAAHNQRWNNQSAIAPSATQ